MKICKRCSVEKSDDSFRFNKNRPNTRSTCKECEKKICLIYRSNNREKEKERCRKYRLENVERVKISKHKTYLKYYKNNSDKIKERVRRYAKSSLGKEKRRDRHIFRSKTDSNYRMLRSLRNRMKAAIEGRLKSDTTFALLGCNKEFLIKHIESQFSNGMNWSNYGIRGWHIDHIVPCYTFNLENTEEQRKCFHYSNLRPLWAKENLSRPRAIVS